MNKVWIIEHQYYDDCYIVGVFSTEEKAKEAFDKLKVNDYYLSINERVLDVYD